MSDRGDSFPSAFAEEQLYDITSLKIERLIL